MARSPLDEFLTSIRRASVEVEPGHLLSQHYEIRGLGSLRCLRLHGAKHKEVLLEPEPPARSLLLSPLVSDMCIGQTSRIRGIL